MNDDAPALRTWYARRGKRALDLACAGGFCLLAAPVLAAAALAVRLTSRGPVVFRQERLGRGGRTFHVLKLRTMTDRPRTADRELLGTEPDITAVGRLLRRTKVDELPQLWNVVVGDMSLVGPRPGLPTAVATSDPVARERLRVRPGLTGLAQVRGNIHLSWPERWRIDAEYVRTLSFALDCRILARTVAVVLLGEHRFLDDARDGASARPTPSGR